MAHWISAQGQLKLVKS